MGPGTDDWTLAHLASGQCVRRLNSRPIATYLPAPERPLSPAPDTNHATPEPGQAKVPAASLTGQNPKLLLIEPIKSRTLPLCPPRPTISPLSNRPPSKPSSNPPILLPTLAADLGIPLTDLLKEIEALTPHLERAQHIAASQTSLHAEPARRIAIETLADIAADPDNDPIERRRAATAILRATNPARPPGPHPRGDPNPEPSHEPSLEPNPDGPFPENNYTDAAPTSAPNASTILQSEPRATTTSPSGATGGLPTSAIHPPRTSPPSHAETTRPSNAECRMPSAAHKPIQAGFP